MKARLLIYLFAAIMLGSCSGVKNCQKPQLDLPMSLAGNATDSITLADMEWWSFYSDSTLVGLIREALEHNRDFLAAAAKVEQMRQLYGVQKLNYAPTVSGLVLADHETNDYHGKPHSDQPEYSLKASLSWEVDLWGGLKWAQRKGAAEFRASVENQRAMQMTLVSEIASAYVNLLALDNELSIVRRTLFTREENLKKAKLRFEGGLTPETVYQQAQVEYASAAALIPGLERQIEIQKNAISLLLGRYPGQEISRGKLSFNEPIRQEFPIGLPSSLLKRRPDLRAAEASLAGALANVGVTYADRFPKLRIGLTGGLENDDLKGFFQSPFTYIVGQISGTILDFGRNKRRYKASIAAYDQSRLNYEQKVLTAFKEVDDAAVTFRLIKQTTERRRELLEAAQKYAQLAYMQYSMGVINYIDVLDAQRRYFEAQVGLSNAVRDEYLALINLYKSLGGGWRI